MSIRIDSPKACSGKAQVGTTCLRDVILAAFPSARSSGIYNCRDVRGGTAWSVHAEGRAVDINPTGKKQGDDIAVWAVRNARKYQIQRVIWYRKLWDYDGGWREYTGQHPHTDHLHIEQNWDGARTCSTRPSFFVQFAGLQWWQYAILVSVAAGGLYQYIKRRR